HTMVIGTKLIGGNIIVSFFDVTERKRAEEMLRDSERKLRSIFAAMTDTILVLDAEGRFLEVAPTHTVLADMHPDKVLGKTLGEVFAPEKAAEFHRAIRTSLSENKPVSLDYNLEIDSRQAWFASTISPLPSDRVIWVSRDVSDRRRAEEEKAKLQNQLLQSQKLEAVGVLAGGVAHDFNNMLGAIMGCAELALVEMDPSDPSRENIVRIVDVTQRSATLTRQLLAFARRQTIEPTVFDVNESIEAVLKMIRRLIGENIELAWLPGAGAYTVRMDPSQFDQVLINLCVNAKDAIGGVGRVAIETDKVSFDRAHGEPFPDFTPGEYVLLAVSDDGCGMDGETMDHIFEPFFTTKGVGRGTGMGLATVYGIVKQNGGGISVYSEKGKGTTFKIYIPRHAAAVAGEKALPLVEVPVSRGETVLIVEDDPTLLDMGTMLLRHLKYSVLSACTPGEAIRVVEENSGEIHLFITDVVMPEMNGRDLADRLLKIRPEMKHLFMSGYTADVIAHQGVLDEGVNFIHKPFSLKELAVKIRKVLD
ncbi:MAG: response regulator, partial [Desulfobacteraceae bacterium]|nr:response regulator [Desulfobacteraceae bacterium]